MWDLKRRQACCKPSRHSVTPAWMHWNSLAAHRRTYIHAVIDLQLRPLTYMGQRGGRRNNDLQLSFSPPPAPPRHTGAPTLNAQTKGPAPLRQTDSRAIWRGATQRVWDYRWTHTHTHTEPQTHTYVHTACRYMHVQEPKHRCGVRGSDTAAWKSYRLRRRSYISYTLITSLTTQHM